MSKSLMPVMKTQCATCPFRKGSKVAELAPYLACRSMQETRICHSTGGNGSIIPKRKNYFNKSHVCRGSRDLQIEFFHSIGFLEEPTDEAWAEKWDEMNQK